MLSSCKSSDDGGQDWYRCEARDERNQKSLTLSKMVVEGGRNRKKTNEKKKKKNERRGKLSRTGEKKMVGLV